MPTHVVQTYTHTFFRPQETGGMKNRNMQLSPGTLFSAGKISTYLRDLTPEKQPSEHTFWNGLRVTGYPRSFV